MAQVDFGNFFIEVFLLMQVSQSDFAFCFFSFFIFLFGTCIGSFLNVCIWRLPRGGSLLSPPSSCPHCGHLIRWFENIPILSWIFLKGKCSSCGKEISPRYAAVEFLCGILYLTIWLKIYYSGEHPAFVFRFFVISALAVSTFFIDIKHFIIPDLTTYPVMVIGLFLAFFFPEGFGFKRSANAFLFSSFGLLSSLLFMSATSILGRSIFKRDALGWGDVKYMGAVGACLGFPGAFFTLLAGSVLGSIYGLFLVIFKEKKIATAIPFGPFLAVSTIVWIFLAEKILAVYFNVSNYLREILN